MASRSASEPRLTVAVTNYNGRALLAAMLDSLDAQTLAPGAILVVDDCSHDGTREYLARARPEVRLLVQPRNLGVTAAMNRCIEESSGELLAMFNNDIELDPRCLEQLVAALDADPRLGSVTPKMLDHAHREVLDGAGDILLWRGSATRRGHGQRDRGQFDAAEEIFGACGGAALYRRAALEAVGPLDHSYFVYYEDVDWSFRAQLLGFRCRYVPSAVVYHHGSATLGRGLTAFNGYHQWRNSLWMLVKCVPAPLLARHAPALLYGQACNLLDAIRARMPLVWASALRDALRGLPAAFAKRRAIQRARVVSSRELDSITRLGKR